MKKSASISLSLAFTSALAFSLQSSSVYSGSSVGQVVLPDGSVQQIFPALPEPETFCTLAMTQFGLTGCAANVVDGTITVMLNDASFILIPQSTSVIPNSITLNPDLTLDYVVQSGSELLSTRISIVAPTQ